jgi:hypothetical protein
MPVDGIRPYIEAADEDTLRRALRAVADQLVRLREVATASAAIGETTKDLAHDRRAVAVQAAHAWRAAGAPPPGLAADAVEAYFSYLGFAAAAVHITFCINGVTAAAAAGLGLTSQPGGPAACHEPPAPRPGT